MKRLGWVPGTKQQRGAKSQCSRQPAIVVGTLHTPHGPNGTPHTIRVYAGEREQLGPSRLSRKDWTGYSVSLTDDRTAD